MKLIVAIALVIGVSALSVDSVAACLCAEMKNAQAAAASADAVFAGTVAGGEAVGGAALPALLSPGETRYTFDVDGVGKGDIGSRAVVRAGDEGASCGVVFTAGERWLVFANIDAGELTTHLCAGNVTLAAGEAAPLPLVAPEPSEAPESGVPIGVLVVAGIVVAAVIGSWLAFRISDRPR
jgi:hypothetical protein